MVGVTIEKEKFDFSAYQIISHHIISDSMVPYLQSDSYNIQGIPHNTDAIQQAHHNTASSQQIGNQNKQTNK
jgi:hypothetical protein